MRAVDGKKSLGRGKRRAPVAVDERYVRKFIADWLHRERFAVDLPETLKRALLDALDAAAPGAEIWLDLMAPYINHRANNPDREGRT
jgi:DNA-binding response OmpR family regulator